MAGEIGIKVPTDTSGLVELIERLLALEERMRSLESTSKAAAAASDELSDSIEDTAEASEKSGKSSISWGAAWSTALTGLNQGLELAKKAVDVLTGALSTALELAESGARSLQVGMAFEALGNTAADMERLREASVGAFDDTTLQKWENFADRAHIGAQAVDTLLASTVTMGQESNKTRVEMMSMFDAVLRGFAKGEGAAFETFGLSMGAVTQRAKDLEPEFDKLSESAKIVAKQTAGLQLIMEMGLVPASDTATASMAQMSSAYDNLISEIEVAVAQFVHETGIVDGLKFVIGEVTKYLTENKQEIIEHAGILRDVGIAVWDHMVLSWKAGQLTIINLSEKLDIMGLTLKAVGLGVEVAANAVQSFGAGVLKELNDVVADAIEGLSGMLEALGVDASAFSAFGDEARRAGYEAEQAAEQGLADAEAAFAANSKEMEHVKINAEAARKSLYEVGGQAEDTAAQVADAAATMQTNWVTLAIESVDWEGFEKRIAAKNSKTTKKVEETWSEMWGRVRDSMVADLGDRSLYEQMIDLIGEGMSSIEVEKIETVMDPFWKNVGESMLTGAQRLGEDVAQRISDALAENAAAITEAKDMAGEIGGGLEYIGLISSQAASQIAENAAVIADATSSSSEAATAGIAAAMTGLESGLGRFLKSERSRAILNIFKEAALAASAIARGIAGDYSQFAAAAAHVAAGVQWGIVAAKAGGGGGGGASATRGASAAGAAASRSSAQLAAGGGFGGPRSRRGGAGAPSQVVINLSSPWISQEQVAQVQQAVEASVRHRDGWAPPPRFSPRGAQSGPGR